MGAKRRFSREFKIEAVERVLGGRRASEVAEELGISAEVLRRWKRDFATGGERAFPGHGRPKPENEELVALRRENARLREERDFLKKAAAYFAKLERRGSK
jgi:transposase